jgi:hypothetical protein
MLIGQATYTALRTLYIELEYLHKQDFLTKCCCKTLNTMGFPSSHFLQQCIMAGTPISLSQVYCHWRYEPLQICHPSLLLVNLLLLWHSRTSNATCKQARSTEAMSAAATIAAAMSAAAMPKSWMKKLCPTQSTRRMTRRTT